MKISHKHFFLAFLGLFLLLTIRSNTTRAFCEISTSCNATETCVLSLAYDTNSHVAECSYYPYKLCCNEIKATTITSGACPENYTNILRMAYLHNTHVENSEYQNYPYKMCVNHMECILKESCENYEACVLSLAYDTNSHVAECDYYPNKLCCIYSNVSMNITEPKNNMKIFRGDQLNMTMALKDSLKDPFEKTNPYFNITMSDDSKFSLLGTLINNGIFVANYTIPNNAPLGEWKILPYAYKKYYRFLAANNVTILVFSNVTVELVRPTDEELYYGFTPGEQIDFEVSVKDETNTTLSNLNVEIEIHNEKEDRMEDKLNLVFNTTKNVYEKKYTPNLDLDKYILKIKTWGGEYMENVTITKMLWIDKIKIDYALDKYRYYPGDTIKITGKTTSFLRGIDVPSNVTVEVLNSHGEVVTTYKTQTDENGVFSTNFKLSKFLDPGVYYVRISAKWSG